MEKQGTSIQSEVNASEESLSKQHSYVLHGACATCQYGSRTARVVVPLCHGSYVHDMPVLTIKDSEVSKNIQIFGYCTCETNPDRIAKMKEILANVEKEDNLLDNIMDGVSSIGKKAKGLFNSVLNVFGVETEKEEEEPEFAEDLKQNVMVVCAPEFAIGSTWVGGSDKLMIKGVPALNSSCTITCIKCGGTLSIVDDGQENAVNEQKGAVDFNQWKEGDPLPNLTQRNVEGLEKNIDALKSKIDSLPEGEEKEKLKAELAAKEALHTTMKDNLSMVNELNESLTQSAYCEDVAGSVDAMEKSGELEKMMKEGKLLDKDGKPIKDMDAAKDYMNNYLEQSNASYKENEATLKTIKDSYSNGTPCVKVDQDVVNNTVKEAVSEAKDNQTSRNWADNGNFLLTGTGTKDDIFTKKDNKDVVDKYLETNGDYAIPYDNFNGKEVNSENGKDVAYIYCNGKLITQNEYQSMVKTAVGETCKSQDIDWD